MGRQSWYKIQPAGSNCVGLEHVWLYCYKDMWSLPYGIAPSLQSYSVSPIWKKIVVFLLQLLYIQVENPII